MDISIEHRLTLTQAANKLGKSPSTLWRWALRGVRGGIKLDSYAEGAQRYTTDAALDKFREACTAAANGETVTQSRTSAQRQRDISKAEHELVNAGI